MWAVSRQGAQDVKRSERPRPVSAGAAARNPARSYDTKLLTLTLDAKAPKSQAKVFRRAERVQDLPEATGSLPAPLFVAFIPFCSGGIRVGGQGEAPFSLKSRSQRRVEGSFSR